MVIEKDRFLFNTLATSLAPFAASQRSLKILANEGRISCDPSEILEAHDPGDSLPLSLLRESVEGIGHFGRRAQARLVLLSAALLNELQLHLVGGLRRAAKIADNALQKLNKQAPKVMSASRELSRHGKSLKSQGCELANATAGSEDLEDFLFGSDISDEVSWFFSSANDNLDAADVDPLATDSDIVEAPGPSNHVKGGVLGRLSSELCRRCRGTSLDRSGSGAGQQCFVYGRIRPVQPCMTLREGIVCHVPDGYIAARGGMLAKLAELGAGKGSPQIFRTMFLDADLTSSSYESCAPAQRRLKERLVQVPEVATSRTSAGLLFASEERDKLLVENLRALKTCGFEAILLSGEFSDVIGSACCEAGLVLAGGIPARLLHALAADCGAEILRGLPDCFETFSQAPWEAKRPIHLHLTHLSNNEHKRCFCYPVFGRRQSLLPEGSGPAMDGPFWELWAWADGTDGVERTAATACTVLLEASCEPQLRQSFAELSDSVLSGMEHLDQTTGIASAEFLQTQYKELPWDWMLLVADALQEVATSETCPALLAEEQTPLIAPWVTPLEDDAGDRAACATFAAALRRAFAAEKDEKYEEDLQSNTENMNAARALLRRGSRLVELLSRVSDTWDFKISDRSRSWTSVLEKAAEMSVDTVRELNQEKVQPKDGQPVQTQWSFGLLSRARIAFPVDEFGQEGSRRQ